MRRWATVATGLAVLAPAATAQRLELGGYAGGVQSNVFTYTDLGVGHDHYRGSGVVVGGYLRMQATGPLLLETNLLYAQKGHGDSNHTRFDYVELPLLLRLDSANDRSRVRFHVHGGLAPALRIWCQKSGEFWDNDQHEAFHYSGSCAGAPVTEAPSTFDLGLVFGFGMGWRFDVGVVDLQLRAVRGLLDVEHEESGKSINRAAYLLVGFGAAP